MVRRPPTAPRPCTAKPVLQTWTFLSAPARPLNRPARPQSAIGLRGRGSVDTSIGSRGAASSSCARASNGKPIRSRSLPAANSRPAGGPGCAGCTHAGVSSDPIFVVVREVDFRRYAGDLSRLRRCNLAETSEFPEGHPRPVPAPPPTFRERFALHCQKPPEPRLDPWRFAGNPERERASYEGDLIVNQVLPFSPRKYEGCGDAAALPQQPRRGTPSTRSSSVASTAASAVATSVLGSERGEGGQMQLQSSQDLGRRCSLRRPSSASPAPASFRSGSGSREGGLFPAPVSGTGASLARRRREIREEIMAWGAGT
eukprot:TRINITY_DN37134_c0_g1_i1.p1 TRINITY_DN37134_c0_g1~~TRINITY_DN37134_c0_g1_i1.p1  ORF type:complete len:324 (-),score=39.74 TRINITY_DN37134_c0_g1_i1:75-1016(-)